MNLEQQHRKTSEVRTANVRKAMFKIAYKLVHHLTNAQINGNKVKIERRVHTVNKVTPSKLSQFVLYRLK